LLFAISRFPVLAIQCAAKFWEAVMAHKEQRSNREKKKPKQDKNKKNAAAQRPVSLFSPPQPAQKVASQQPQNKTSN
jgi:hypothetical protein